MSEFVVKNARIKMANGMHGIDFDYPIESMTLKTHPEHEDHVHGDAQVAAAVRYVGSRYGRVPVMNSHGVPAGRVFARFSLTMAQAGDALASLFRHLDPKDPWEEYPDMLHEIHCTDGSIHVGVVEEYSDFVVIVADDGTDVIVETDTIVTRVPVVDDLP